MHAEDIIAFTEAMRSYALESGRDLNAANLFAHRMLVRALSAEQRTPFELPPEPDDHADAA